MQVLWSEEFDSQVEKLARKHRLIYDDIEDLIDKIESGLRPGYQLRGVKGLPVKWTRLGNRSANKGKRGGFRVVYYFDNELILLIMIDTRAEVKHFPPERVLQILKDEGFSLT